MQLDKSLGAGICRQLLRSHTSHASCTETQRFSSGTTAKTLIRNEDPFQFSAILVLTSVLLAQAT